VKGRNQDAYFYLTHEAVGGALFAAYGYVQFMDIAQPPDYNTDVPFSLVSTGRRIFSSRPVDR